MVGAESFQIIWVIGVRPNLIIVVCGRVPWLYQYWSCGFRLFVVLCPGTPEGSTGSGSGFKASQKTGQRLKVSSDRLGEGGNRTCDPWFTRHRFIPYTTAASLITFCGFPWVETSTAGRVYDLCVYYMNESTRRLTESGWFFTKSFCKGGWYI